MKLRIVLPVLEPQQLGDEQLALLWKTGLAPVKNFPGRPAYSASA